jgi:hypothetical protein
MFDIVVPEDGGDVHIGTMVSGSAPIMIERVSAVSNHDALISISSFFACKRIACRCPPERAGLFPAGCAGWVIS